MLNPMKITKAKTTVSQALSLPLFGIIVLIQPAFAGNGSTPGFSFGNSLYAGTGTTTLRTPLVPGASFSLPYIPPAAGAPPPIGSGFVPMPVNPGMLLTPPTLIPWTNGSAGNQFSQPTNQAVIPANQIDQQSNQISLPLSNASALPPGAFNAQVRGVIPHSPSTPGQDPGMLRPPSFANGSSAAGAGQNYESAGVLTQVDQNGQLPDLLTGQGSNQRNSRQGVADYGLKRTTFGFRAQFSNNNGQSTFQQWVPKLGSTTTDNGLGVRGSMAKGQLGSKFPPQISFDSPFAATYAPLAPTAGTGSLNQNSRGNHKKNFLGAQVTNDLYGTPMINPNKITTTTGGQVQAGPPPQPLTTIANY